MRRLQVLLKGLQLVPEALSEGLDIPVDVKWGHVGLFQLSVPWSKLGSKPVSHVRAAYEPRLLLGSDTTCACAWTAMYGQQTVAFSDQANGKTPVFLAGTGAFCFPKRRACVLTR